MSRVRYEREGHLATVTLARPEKRNALDAEMLGELSAAWTKFRDDDDAWVAILAAEGDVFCAGADRRWLAGARDGDDVYGTLLAASLEDPYWSGSLGKPTIAAVQGAAIGAGLDLAFQADLRVAGEGALFQLPEVVYGSVLVLWDNLPYAIAAEIVSGAPIDAKRAYEIGMVNRLVEPEIVLSTAQELAHELLERSPLALQSALSLLREMRAVGGGISSRELRRRALRITRDLTQSDDWHEAMAALAERRTPRFRGR